MKGSTTEASKGTEPDYTVELHSKQTQIYTRADTKCPLAASGLRRCYSDSCLAHAWIVLNRLARGTLRGCTQKSVVLDNVGCVSRMATSQSKAVRACGTLVSHKDCENSWKSSVTEADGL